MKIPSSFGYQVIAPMLLGFVIGLTNIFGCDDFVLKKLDYWLHDNPTGTFMLGLYLVILGMVGIAGFLIDTENLKNHIRKISFVAWYSKLAGLLSGLTISAIIFGSTTEIILLGFYSALLFAITWMFWTFEKMVFAETPDEGKKKLVSGAASACSLLIGVFAFYLAWNDSQGGQL
jgi:uncharacterized protein YacL